MTEEHLDEIYAVNVRALFFITQGALPRLNEGGADRLDELDRVARAPFPAVAAYSMLKAPVDNLTKSVSPKTDMGEFLKSPEGADLALGKQALKRIGKADDAWLALGDG